MHVVIPTYGDPVDETLSALDVGLALIPGPHKVVVVDDGTPWPVPATHNPEHYELEVMRLPERVGSRRARNLGAGNAAPVLFCDARTLVEPEAPAALLDGLNLSDDVHIAAATHFGDDAEVAGLGRRLVLGAMDLDWMLPRDLPYEAIWAPGLAPALVRGPLEGHYFAEWLPGLWGAEDTELAFRTHAHGRLVVGVRAAVATKQFREGPLPFGGAAELADAALALAHRYLRFDMAEAVYEYYAQWPRGLARAVHRVLADPPPPLAAAAVARVEASLHAYGFTP